VVYGIFRASTIIVYLRVKNRDCFALSHTGTHHAKPGNRSQKTGTCVQPEVESYIAGCSALEILSTSHNRYIA